MIGRAVTILATAIVASRASELTSENFKSEAMFAENGGKNAFVKFLAPW